MSPQSNPPLNNTRQVGSEGEKLALEYLLQQGFELWHQNQHQRWAELDLVMWEGPVLVFIEVKYRRSLRCGYPLESINRAKQRKWFKAAQLFLLKHPYAGPMRFDALGILRQEDGRYHYEHIRNALVQ